LIQDLNDWPLIAPLPSYGRGRDEPGPRYSNFIGGSNLTDVIISGKTRITTTQIIMTNPRTKAI
jgi:hypothetical protein